MSRLTPPEPDAAPTTIECPCGNGYAEHREWPTIEPGADRRFARLIWHYRHDDCPLGGHVVVENGAVVREAGPVFEPDRFGAGTEGAAGETAVADGGEVVRE